MTTLIERAERLASALDAWDGLDLPPLLTVVGELERWVAEAAQPFAELELPVKTDLWCSLTAAATKVIAQLVSDSIDAEEQGWNDRVTEINTLGQKLQTITLELYDFDPLGRALRAAA